LAQLPGHLGGLALRPDLHLARLVLHPGGTGPGPRLHVGPGGEFFHGFAEMILGVFDLLLNFWRGHLVILPRNFLDFLNIGSDDGLPVMNAATAVHEAAGGDDRAR
jgi:hypothetical protein